MNAFLHPPFTPGVCVLTLIAWVGMLCAIFWPGPHHPSNKDEPDVRF